MNNPGRYFLLLFLALLFTDTVLAAGDDDTGGDSMWQVPTIIKKQWKEASTHIPPLPKQQDLLPFKVFNSRFQYFIDSKSLNVSSGDNIARYTVVVISPSGIHNTLYEGIRCDTQQYKTYAYSVKDEPLKAIDSAQWQYIPQTGSAAFRFELFKNFLCKDSIIRDKKKYIIQLFESSSDHYDNE